jgi:hypothetical protein
MNATWLLTVFIRLTLGSNRMAKLLQFRLQWLPVLTVLLPLCLLLCQQGLSQFVDPSGHCQVQQGSLPSDLLCEFRPSTSHLRQ